MAAGSTAQDAQAAGLYCSTSGTVFTDKESLTEHYKSDFHRYNLKRKVAGLPPVTHEWFLARKSQLTSIAEGPPVQRIWVCPLTNKKFLSENTYVAHTKSKKYRQALKESGGPPPQPHVIVKRDRPSAEPESARPTTSATAPTAFNITPAAKSGPAAEQAKRELHAAGSLMDAATTAGMDAGSDSNDDAHSDSSDWETDTDGDDDEGNEQASRLQQGDSQDAEEHQDASEWEEWDVCVSLFDNHVSASFEANLDYMYKHFGFFLPDAEYLTDPQGLMKYLGAKLRYGGIPLHARGDDPNAKQFRSLHAVQRHMVDTALTQMLYDDNEEEYEDFYDYSAMEEEEEQAKALVAAQVEQAAEQGAAGELEIVVPGRSGGAAGGRILGARDFARYYRQRHRAPELRHSVVVNQLVQRYRNLGIATITDGKTAEEKRRSKEAMKQRRRADAQQVRQQMKQNVINNLPRNVPY